MEAIKFVLDFQWAADFSTGTIRAIFIAFFALVLIFVLMQKRDFVYEGAPDDKAWRDLRVWAAAVLVLQGGLYLFI